MTDLETLPVDADLLARVQRRVSIAGSFDAGGLGDGRRVVIARAGAPLRHGRPAQVWRDRYYFAFDLEPGDYTATLCGNRVDDPARTSADVTIPAAGTSGERPMAWLNISAAHSTDVPSSPKPAKTKDKSTKP